MTNITNPDDDRVARPHAPRRTSLECGDWEAEHSGADQRERGQCKRIVDRIDGESDRVGGLDRVVVSGHQSDGTVTAKHQGSSGNPQQAAALCNERMARNPCTSAPER